MLHNVLLYKKYEHHSIEQVVSVIFISINYHIMC